MRPSRSTSPAREPRRSRRGATLIVALGVLTLMTMLAVLFVNIMTLELKATVNFGEKLRSRLVAEAGLTTAMAEVRNALARHTWTDPATDAWVYGTAQHSGYGLPLIGPLKADHPSLEGRDDSLMLRRGDGVFVGAAYPSFRTERDHEEDAPYCPYGDHKGAADGESGDRDPVSGVIGSDAYYLTKVLDCSGQVNVNDQDFDGVIYPPLLGVLARLPGMDPDKDGVSEAAQAVLAARHAQPGGRFTSKEQVRAAIVEALGEEEGTRTWQRVRDYLNVHGAQFPVLRPVQSLDRKSASYRGTGARLPLVYPQVTEWRTPLNINVAPREVLVAVLAGLAGTPLEEQQPVPTVPWFQRYETVGQGGGSTLLGFWRVGDTVEISRAEAEKVADEILRARSSGFTNPHTGRRESAPISSWRQFFDLVDSMGERPVELAPLKRELIKAQADPNARFMGYNPDASRRRHGWYDLADAATAWPYRNGFVFDKACLSRWSTEFCLGPMGVFEIQCVGRIVGRTGEVKAQSEVSRTVRVFTPRRVDTQAGFLQTLQDYRAAYGDPGDKQSVVDALREDGVQLGPESLPARWVDGVDHVDGHVRLTTEGLSVPDKGLLAAGGHMLDGWGLQVVAGGGVGTTTKDPAKPLSEFGQLAPDGALCWKIPFEEAAKVPGDLVYEGPVGDLATRGAAEFWIKLLHDGSVGADEAWFTLIVDDTAHRVPEASVNGSGYKLPDRAGTALKLERFGSVLRASWFYWGKDPRRRGGVSRFVHCYNETWSDIGPWRAGEWHRVALVWNNVSQIFQPSSSRLPVSAQNPVQLYLDGVKATSSWSMPTIQGVEDTRVVKLQGVTRQVGDMRVNIGQVQSVPSDIPESRFRCYVGGFTQAMTPGIAIWRTGTTPSSMPAQGNVRRYPNATLDDLYLYKDPASYKAAQNPARFVGSGEFSGAFRLPAGRSDLEPLALEASVELPEGTEVSGPSLPDRQHWREREGVLFIPYTVSLRYRSGAQGTRAYGRVTPVLEDVTLYLGHTPEVLEDAAGSGLD